MAETTVAKDTQQRRVAVVTGANKGIGLEIARQLLDSGITVVLTSRDEGRGLEAVEKLKQQQQLLPSVAGVAEAALEFHRLDVTDAGSIAELADFIKTRFGKLDILVNNAATFGFALDPDHLVTSPVSASSRTSSEIDGADIQYESEMAKLYKALAASPAETFDGAREAIDVNFYGTKRTTEALLPLLRLSSSPRIVNVSSLAGTLQLISNESVRKELNDVDRLTEDRLDELLLEFLAGFRDGKGWRAREFAYSVSKAALNAYTRTRGSSPEPSTAAASPSTAFTRGS